MATATSRSAGSKTSGRPAAKQGTPAKRSPGKQSAGAKKSAAKKAPAKRSASSRTSRRTSGQWGPDWLGPALLWLAVLRGVLGIVAIPLAPMLYRKHFVVLVLLRPTKDVLLAAGFLVKRHDVGVPMLLTAAIPLLLLGVWQFYALGRIYGTASARRRLPRFARHVLPEKKLDAMCQVLEKKGTPVILVGRLAAMPSTVLAAAAGASNMEGKKFLRADTIGGLLSFVEAVGAGWALGAAYEDAGPWLTAGGFVALAVVAVLVGRWLRRV
jgi:membrane protein DedA with SNARE-associated domain